MPGGSIVPQLQFGWNPGFSLIPGLSLSFNLYPQSGGIAQQPTIATPPPILPPAPPPPTPLPTMVQPRRSKLRPHITGIANTENQDGPIPLILGDTVIRPTLAARQVTEIVGKNQFLMALFCLGHGRLDVSEIKIGDKLITEFEEVTTEIREGTAADAALTIFTRDIEETALGDELKKDVTITKQAGQPADRLSVDLAFPDGLYNVNAQGVRSQATVTVKIEYRLAASSDSWTNVGNLVKTDNTTSFARASKTWNVTRALYEIRLTRLTNDATSTNISRSLWSIVRAFDSTTPAIVAIKDDAGTAIPLSFIAVRIRATDQIQGQIDQLNCRVKSYLPVYNGSTWSYSITSNPAWALAHVLTCGANRAKITLAQLDADQFLAFANFCASKGFTYNRSIDDDSTVLDVMNSICAMSRASWSRSGFDGKYSVVIDDTKSVVAQWFSARNAYNFSGGRTFTKFPHALRCKFLNKDAKYEPDTRIVYDDGYDSTNAFRFESVELLGVTDKDHAWKIGRYLIAAARLRSEKFQFTTDWEGLACTRGDKIKLAHDVAQIGQVQARIVSLTTNGGGDITAVTLDDTVTIAPGNNYLAEFRLKNLTERSESIVNTPGNTSTILLTTPIPAATNPKPEVGDLLFFGITPSLECLIESVEYIEDEGATITCVPYAPGVFTADSGSIPPHTPVIEFRPVIMEPVAVPSILSIRSDESVLVRDVDGALRTRIQIVCDVPDLKVTVFEHQFRATDSEEWSPSTRTFVSDGEVSVFGVEDGLTYIVRLRSVTFQGQASDWTTTEPHFVIGKTTPPPDVPDLHREGDTLIVRYDTGVGVTVPRDFAGFRWKYIQGQNTNWANGFMISDLTLSNQLSLEPLPVGLVTYMVKAVDVANNESANAAFLVLNLGDPVLNNIVLQTAHHPTFTLGTITNGTVTGGVLKANDAGGLFWSGNNNAPFWSGNNAALFWGGGWLELTYRFFVTVAKSIRLPCRMTLDYDIVAEGFKIEYRTLGQTLFWDNSPGGDSLPFWDGSDADLFWGDDETQFSPWPGEIFVEYETYEFLITCPASTLVQAVISTLTVLLDVEDQVEYVNSQTISSGGTRLTLTKSFAVIKNVNLTVEFNAGFPNAFTAQKIDENILGPLVKVFDTAGVATSGIVDAIVQGY
jgi:hypothetical protein